MARATPGILKRFRLEPRGRAHVRVPGATLLLAVDIHHVIGRASGVGGRKQIRGDFWVPLIG